MPDDSTLFFQCTDAFGRALEIVDEKSADGPSVVARIYRSGAYSSQYAVDIPDTLVADLALELAAYLRRKRGGDRG